MSDRPQAELAREILAELRALSQTSSEMAAHVRGAGQIANGVLEVAQWVIGSDGTIVRSFSAQVGSVIITNATANSVTVVAGTHSSGSAPTQGRGVQVVPANSWLAIPIGSHSVTIYGAVGASIGVQAYAGMHALGVRA